MSRTKKAMVVVEDLICLPPPKQARALLIVAENRLRDPNFCNAKILCQSEYLILPQTALAELVERLAALDGTMDGGPTVNEIFLGLAV
jgi:hypothetical protein